jgi:hypothetical protein
MADDMMTCRGVRQRRGIPWYCAPLPHQLHECSVWATGQLHVGVIHRCACGAFSVDGVDWFNRNERREWEEL